MNYALKLSPAHAWVIQTSVRGPQTPLKYCFLTVLSLVGSISIEGKPRKCFF